MPSRAHVVADLKSRYSRRRVRVPSGARIVRGRERKPSLLDGTVEGTVTGWEAWESRGQISGVLLIRTKGEFIRVRADVVELLPEPPPPPSRFPGRRRPSALAERQL